MPAVNHKILKGLYASGDVTNIKTNDFLIGSNSLKIGTNITGDNNVVFMDRSNPENNTFVPNIVSYDSTTITLNGLGSTDPFIVGDIIQVDTSNGTNDGLYQISDITGNTIDIASSIDTVKYVNTSFNNILSTITAVQRVRVVTIETKSDGTFLYKSGTNINNFKVIDIDDIDLRTSLQSVSDNTLTFGAVTIPLTYEPTLPLSTFPANIYTGSITNYSNALDIDLQFENVTMYAPIIQGDTHDNVIVKMWLDPTTTYPDFVFKPYRLSQDGAKLINTWTFENVDNQTGVTLQIFTGGVDGYMLPTGLNDPDLADWFFLTPVNSTTVRLARNDPQSPFFIYENSGLSAYLGNIPANDSSDVWSKIKRIDWELSNVEGQFNIITNLPPLNDQLQILTTKVQTDANTANNELVTKEFVNNIISNDLEPRVVAVEDKTSLQSVSDNELTFDYTVINNTIITPSTPLDIVTNSVMQIDNLTQNIFDIEVDYSNLEISPSTAITNKDIIFNLYIDKTTAFPDVQIVAVNLYDDRGSIGNYIYAKTLDPTTGTEIAEVLIGMTNQTWTEDIRFSPPINLKLRLYNPSGDNIALQVNQNDNYVFTGLTDGILPNITHCKIVHQLSNPETGTLDTIVINTPQVALKTTKVQSEDNVDDQELTTKKYLVDTVNNNKLKYVKENIANEKVLIGKETYLLNDPNIIFPYTYGDFTSKLLLTPVTPNINSSISGKTYIQFNNNDAITFIYYNNITQLYNINIVREVDDIKVYVLEGGPPELIGTLPYSEKIYDFTIFVSSADFEINVILDNNVFTYLINSSELLEITSVEIYSSPPGNTTSTLNSLNEINPLGVDVINYKLQSDVNTLDNEVVTKKYILSRPKFSMPFGGNIGGKTHFLWSNGDGTKATNGNLNYNKRHVIAEGGYLTISYNIANSVVTPGDKITFSIFINDSSDPINDPSTDISIEPNTGVYDSNIYVNTGDTIAVQFKSYVDSDDTDIAGVPQQTLMLISVRHYEVDNEGYTSRIIPGTPVADPLSAASYLYYDESSGRVVSIAPIQTTLNSFYIGDQHIMSSGAENIFFSNQSSNVDYFPSWSSVSAAHWDRMTSRTYTELQTVDNVPNATTKDAKSLLQLIVNTSIFNFETEVREVLNAGEKVQIDVYYYSGDVDEVGVIGTATYDNNKGIKIYTQSEIVTSQINSGERLLMTFDHPLEAHVGTKVAIELCRFNSDGVFLNFLQVAGTDSGDNRFHSVQHFKIFEDKPLALVEELYTGVIDANLESLDFSLDATSTSVLVSNGEHYGVNTIKAVDDGGVIKILSFDDTGKVYITNIDPQLVSINGTNLYTSSGAGIFDIVNTLNELFTVGPFEQVIISDPYSTNIANVNGEDTIISYQGTGVDPAGDDVGGSTVSGADVGGVLSEAVISKAGEYFTFDIRNESIIGMGLVHTQSSYDSNYYVGDAALSDPSSFCDNVGSYGDGYQFSVWFHPDLDGPWATNGANSNKIQSFGWTDQTLGFSVSDEGTDWVAGNPVKMRVGLDINSFISIDYYDVSASAWIVITRSTYPVLEGSTFNLGIKFGDTIGRLYSTPKVHLLPIIDTPTTLGDQTIQTFGDVTGTLATGVVVPDATDRNDGFITVESISQPGEYFEVTWSGNVSTIGLFSENDYDYSDLTSHVGSMGNEDYVYWGSRTNTGSLNFLYRDGHDITSTTPNGSPIEVDAGVVVYKARFGFDLLGRPTTWFRKDGTNYIVYRQGQSPSPSGEYKFIMKGYLDGAQIDDVTKGQLVATPTMYFRYIEAFDGQYDYPLFASQEEVEYYNDQEGNTTTDWTQVIYPDDPSNTLWYRPFSYTSGASTAPTSAILFPSGTGVPISWTEITSLSDSALIPEAFTDATITVDELSSVNYPLAPVGATYTVTIGGIPNWSVSNDNHLIGTAPEVADDNVANPSDTTTVTVYRTNLYGTSSGTLTIVITNLTAPATAITGFTWDPESNTLLDEDTLRAGSVITMDDTVESGKRFIIPRTWVDAYILPALQEAGDYVIMGIKASTGDFTFIQEFDFDFYMKWEYSTASSHISTLSGDTTSTLTINSLITSFYDYAIEVDGTDVHIIACNVNDINTQPAVNSGGTFGRVVSIASYTGTIPLTVKIGAVLTSMDYAVADLSKIDIPIVTSTTTPFNYALDFSGGSEHITQYVTGAYNTPVRMGGLGVTTSAPLLPGYTSNDVNARPWATCIVFKTDRNNSNQHIWNMGEGAGSPDDNIYLRHDSTGILYFGWGRQSALNECRLTASNLRTTSWYAVYIAHNGQRLSGNDATAANLASCFDIRMMAENDSSIGAGQFTGGLWNRSGIGSSSIGWEATDASVGGRMDRTFDGASIMAIGGRGTNRNFHGSVASFISTTLKRNVLMPDQTQIVMMIKNPIKWYEDYLHGNTGRIPDSSSKHITYALNSSNSGNATQIWLMGDGVQDSYANGIRNYLFPTITNSFNLQLNNMVSNDLINVSILGLS